MLKLRSAAISSIRPLTGAAIAYISVLTARQGRSGLGLEAQRRTIAEFCKREGLAIGSEALLAAKARA